MGSLAINIKDIADTVDDDIQVVLLKVLLIPVIFPLLYACVCATSVAFTGVEGTFGAYWTSCALAAAYDVIMIAAAWGLYEFVLDA